MHTTKLILSVEDEPKLADLISEYLAQAGFSAHRIANGGAVLEWVSANTPDLVLLDLILPGRDGLDRCRERWI